MTLFKQIYKRNLYATGSKIDYKIPVRVRFAPSPTGYLHLGGLRTALFNYLLARKTGGKFLLRIEDTDRTRFVADSVDNLLSVLSWAGLSFDELDEGSGNNESPRLFYQSERTKIYKSHVDKLINDGNAYRCFCTLERLKEIRIKAQRSGKGVVYDRHCLHLSQKEIEQKLAQGIPFTIRLKTPNGVVIINDLVHGNVEFNDKHIDDAILLKSDGYPTYHLANVIDDHSMGITHVLRGEEWLSSTPKHIILYKLFGWELPNFVHLPLLLNTDKSKLSKRSGDINVEDFANKGYLPEALINFVALLGWSPVNSKNDVFTMEELISEFTLEHLGHSGTIVMREKLDWLNKQHILRKTESEGGLKDLVNLLKPSVNERFAEKLKSTKDKYRLEDEYLTNVITVMKDRIRNIKDIPELCEYFFIEPNYHLKDSRLLRKKIPDDVLKTISNLSLTKLNEFKDDELEFQVDKIKPMIQSIATQTGYKQNLIMMTLRYIITGIKVGAGVAETMKTIGKEACLKRINKVLASLNN
ncbi:15023_t:CDS:10 [Funneliformis caledonium]|uniref:Glutamate--tRNA ligase, mitochondrial n=1 Tax=Funneliformis caledonium TaxID=1117310 RepID=A0A9N9FWI9_9GLOM|nr:15023_t:CDS:10 [Funneliformis caledonium]